MICAVAIGCPVAAGSIRYPGAAGSPVAVGPVVYVGFNVQTVLGVVAAAAGELMERWLG